MYIKSNDIVEFEKNNKIFLYNKFTNTACIVMKEWYENNFKNLIIIKDDRYSKFSKEYDLLLKYNMIYSEYTSYINNDYINKIKSRDSSIKIRDVYLHITQRCNLRCSYCYNKENLNSKDVLKLKDFFLIIDELSNIDVKRIIITGGEPLINEDIYKIVEYIKKKKLQCEILTNGVFLKKRENVLELVDSVTVSLDTLDPSLNDREGLNVITLKNILLSIDSKYRNKIIIRSVISRKNQNHWRKVLKFSEDNGYRFKSSLFLPNDILDTKLLPDKEKLSFDFDELNFTFNICGAGYKEIAINYNGDIYPCQSLISKGMYITNIFNKNWMNEIKNSEIINRFRKLSVDNIEGCCDCDIKYLCGGGCRAIPYKLYGSVTKKSIPICEYMKNSVKNKIFTILTKEYR